MTKVSAENLAPRRVASSAFLGLLWGASLRAWMSLLALQLGDRPTITWLGTFAGILLPATLLGVLVGQAVYVAATSSRERWRWVLLSPLILILGSAIANPGFVSTLLATGMGGGAIGVALVGVLGGYTFSGVGPRWTRASCGLLALLFGLASVVPSYLAGRSLAIPPSADEVFGGLLFALLMVALVAGISAPSRVRSRRSAHPVPRTWLPNNSLKLTRLIAYLKSVPPVDNQFPERRIELLGRLLMAVGLFPVPAVDKIDHTSPPGELPMAGVSIASGRYLTRTCLECHGASLNGAPFGPPGQEVPTPNLTPGGVLAGWTKEQFFTTIRTGINPGGHRLSDDMPWGNFGQMTDEELGSVWLYLQSLAALPQGG